MRIPLAFPNVGEGGDPGFAAFALLSGTLIEAVSEREMDVKRAIVTMYLASRPDVTSEIVDFTSNLNARITGSDMIERLGLPEDTEFKAAGLRYTGPDGNLITEMLCVGVSSEELKNCPPPDCPKEADVDFNVIVAEAAAEAGFIIAANPTGEIMLESPGIDAALNAQLTKQIEVETEKFRAELDSVFDTWKGGTT